MNIISIQSLILAATIGYFLGSVPFGLIITQIVGVGDIRKIGSGNIGATNVLRTGNKLLAAFTLSLDLGKGAFATILCFRFFNQDASLIAGLMAVLGHNFPIWLKFKGGKGVATTLGVLLAAYWPAGATSCVIWLVVATISRYSSLAALISLTSAPIYLWWFGSYKVAVLAGSLVLISIFRHHQNIKNLFKGQENKIGG